MLFAVVGACQLSFNIGVMLKGSGAVISACVGEQVSSNLIILIMTALFAIYGMAGGLSAAIIMKGVGAIVVFAMLVSPGATALLFGSSVRRVMIWAFVIAVGAGLVSIVLSFFVDFSVSALAAILSASSYFVARGWLWVAGIRSE